ncbi:MAG TPA: hydantoinase/oxoprolinase family protein [Candidatus Copromorpha excrementigallinarum]|uniref:Hydantoinase/oxoprolinase family protein n=1 Tax=Candidatus Allocopromorpha excrementigallinarum TaxID=2840742 RepID=A0A9D1HYS7_9FIRM|nr:hydantoinase/oxoprolinase family protein [Candidatus Copromorpha excrementigallinarum]
MKKIIGIDTGGTYTDIVVIDADTRDILITNKTLTTKNNLEECISQSFDSIPGEMLRDISMVCLSTTLATNAIVEGRGCKVGLILIGGRPRGKMISRKVSVIKGKYDIKGRLKENLDVEEVRKTVESYRGRVDAIAVSGYASVRNPAHEIYVKQVVDQTLGIPVACAHDLTSSLGFYERTVTVNLNAKLIPMVCELMDAVRDVMGGCGIEAPLMIVKGEGSLMTDVCARSKPIDTILSGPAASVNGGMYLSGEKDAFIVDMGGTTTDIANITEGKVALCNEGAKVGGWFTHVRAAEIFTVGLGGDSRIALDLYGKIKVGPEKSIPLSLAAERYPDLKKEIKFMYDHDYGESFLYRDYEAYILAKKFENLSYNSEERIIIEILRYMPHTLDYLKKNVDLDKLEKVLDNLVKESVIMRISLTPTDILHLTGEYRMWDSEIVEMAVRVICRKYGKGRDEFLEEVQERIVEKLDSSFIQSAMFFDNKEVDMSEGSLYDYFLNDLFFRRTSKVLQAEYRIPKKLVGIGAPAGAWLTRAGDRLRAEITVPRHAEVANAVGAAVGKAIETIEILIRPDSVTHKFLVYSPLDRVAEDTLEEATEYALKIGEECIKRMSEKREYKVEHSREDMYFDDLINDVKIFMERRIILSARFN